MLYWWNAVLNPMPTVIWLGFNLCLIPYRSTRWCRFPPWFQGQTDEDQSGNKPFSTPKELAETRAYFSSQPLCFNFAIHVGGNWRL